MARKRKSATATEGPRGGRNARLAERKPVSPKTFAAATGGYRAKTGGSGKQDHDSRR